ncbi:MULTISPECIES: Asp23/Gls24 family envelope stress response protein [Petrotoga]|uniref:Alkaline shock protein n=2 Tax=Petrotoga sibirica TaxID=156202 RepID=A0A855MPF2_9BACT|nr:MULTISPECIES: Asp23/Gls24 family envelope stress response protein [Petrotoga]POZ88838.1 hypothetical protein AA80_04465 [Petrotoga sibirica DSM 13575]POZ90956.1 hypothetical protein AD60_05270 [Petrotoga sp. SL27]TDX17459.1 putative alkaline shock family protein YloU [Petrotoga sibirica]
MSLNEENDFGEISISENVLKDLVFKSVEDYMKEQKVYNEKIQKDLQKSIKITINDDSSVSVSLKVPAKYGENIVEFSKNIQKAVKDDLERIAEVYISNIDISIENLVKPEELEEYEEIEEETLENEETPESEEKEDEEKREKNE